jgi:hypothetical protein
MARFTIATPRCRSGHCQRTRLSRRSLRDRAGRCRQNPCGFGVERRAAIQSLILVVSCDLPAARFGSALRYGSGRSFASIDKSLSIDRLRRPLLTPEYLFRGHPTGILAGILSARGVPHPFVIRTPGSLDSTAKTQLPMDPGLSRAVQTAQPRHRAAPGTPALAETVGGHPASRAKASGV